MLNRPPSVTSTLPLRYPPAFDVKYKTAPAISCAVPGLLSGMVGAGILPSEDSFAIGPSASSLGNTMRSHFPKIFYIRDYDLHPGAITLLLIP